MDFMQFPGFGGNNTAPKVEATLENLLKEETWARFHPLGEWVHKVPQQLNTLWTSKNADEVTEAAKQMFSALFLAHSKISAPEDEQEADEDSLILIVELLIQIIRFSWPILKSGDTLKKGSLFKQLIIMANDFEIPTDDPWGGPPSPVKALSKATEFIDDLLANAKDDLDMLQCCAVVSIRSGMASSTDNDLMVKLMQPITTVTDDATRACFVYSAAQLAKESFFVNDEHKKNLADMCSNMLSLPDVSLAKLIAALVTARSQTNHASAEVLHILADYLLHYEAYEKIFDTTPLGIQIDLSYAIPNFVSSLNPASDIFFTRVLQNLKTLDGKSDLNPMALPVATLLSFNYGMKEPILPGMKVIDLQPMSVTLLKTLVELNQFWTNEKILNFLAKRGIPKKEDLVAFLADNVDDGTKRFPKFAGLDEIPWDKLGHAYGEATDVPDLLRMLASVNPQKRKRAQHALYANIYHQGTTYSATPYAVPYLIEMLECTLVQEKAHILEYLINLLASFPEGYFCKKTGFDVNVEYPLAEDEPEAAHDHGEAGHDHGEEADHNHDGEEEHEHDEEDDDHDHGHGHGGYCGIKHKIEQHLVNGLPTFFDMLKDPNPQGTHVFFDQPELLTVLTKNHIVRGVTANVLAFLPRVAEQTVPKIKEQLQVDTDSSTKGSLLLALGMLLPRVASHEECLKFFNDQWDLVKGSEDETVKFCIAASIGRLLIGQKPPKFALDQLLTAVGKQDTPIAYHAFDRPSTLAMGLITVLKADDALTHIIQQFKNTTQMFQVLPVLRAMLSIAFRFEIENDKPIQPATLKPEQLEVLQAIVDHGDNLVWGFGNASMMLRDDFQLPGNKERLIEFIEKAKASKDVMEM